MTLECDGGSVASMGDWSVMHAVLDLDSVSPWCQDRPTLLVEATYTGDRKDSSERSRRVGARDHSDRDCIEHAQRRELSR